MTVMEHKNEFYDVHGFGRPCPTYQNQGVELFAWVVTKVNYMKQMNEYPCQFIPPVGREYGILHLGVGVAGSSSVAQN